MPVDSYQTKLFEKLIKFRDFVVKMFLKNNKIERF